MSTVRHITVVGEASRDVEPDEVKVTFGIDTFDEKLAIASKKSEEASTSFVAAVKQLGLKDCHLQMAAMSVEVQSDHYKQSPVANVTGYVTRRTYTITLEKNNLDLLEKLIAAGLNNGANRLSNVDTNVVQIAKVKQEVMREAVRAALEKATLMATELGAKVGPVTHISEQHHSRGGAQSFSAGYGAPRSSGGSMPLGSVPVSAAVEVDFSLV